MVLHVKLRLLVNWRIHFGLGSLNDYSIGFHIGSALKMPNSEFLLDLVELLLAGTFTEWAMVMNMLLVHDTT